MGAGKCSNDEYVKGMAEMKKRLYVAYGSNLNLEQMNYRCPTAKMYGTGVIEDYELQFKGRPTGAYATIAPKEGSSVPVAVWEIQPRDEIELDHYEGYPNHYFKHNVTVKMHDREIDAMAYIMNLKMEFGLPSPIYFKTVYEGYNDCNLNPDLLLRAVASSAESFYSSAVRVSHYQISSDEDEADVCDDELYDEDEEEKLSYFEGMHM